METQQLHRGRLIDHIQLVVRDLKASRDFYAAALGVFDIPIVDTQHDFFWADELVVSSASSPAALGELTGRHHLAFQAKDRATVDAFHRAALARATLPPRLLRRVRPGPGRQQYRSRLPRRRPPQRPLGGHRLLRPAPG